MSGNHRKLALTKPANLETNVDTPEMLPLLTDCVNLFNQYYGVWSSKSPKYGKRVKMSMETLKVYLTHDRNFSFITRTRSYRDMLSAMVSRFMGRSTVG